MYLLNVDTLSLETFYDSDAPRYAILSHTWGSEEVTFADIQRRDMQKLTSLAGFQKIQKTCDQARMQGFRYVWIDTCCIDKTSSTELSEAINSMFRWYQSAIVCYAYLSDVTKDEFPEEFPKSRWFTRGWTLQELLAPSHLFFYDRDWQSLGTKSQHADWLSDITLIDLEALCQNHITPTGLGYFCIAKRMSWASNRTTTRVEDIAYCLLGIFGINMPLLYGEKERAFVRLQEELIKNHDDDSILAWGLDPKTWHPSGSVPDVIVQSICNYIQIDWRRVHHCQTSVLASSPADFKGCRDLDYAGVSLMKPSTITNAGLQIELPVIAVYLPKSSYPEQSPEKAQGWIGLLSCSTRRRSKFLGIVLRSKHHADEEFAIAERVSYTYDQDIQAWHTVLVGPRLAMQAEMRSITICQASASRIARYQSGWRSQFVVDESQALIDSDYVVSYGTAWVFFKFVIECRPEWDADAKMLMITGGDSDYCLQTFAFRGPRSDSGFTVHVLGSKSMVHEGYSMEWEEQKNAFDSLKRAEDPAPYMIKSLDGTEKLVTVVLRESLVHNTRIVELTVDLVDKPPNDQEQLA